MTPKIWISAGGTGGHLFPALVLADELHERLPQAEICFIGGNLAKNPYFARGTYPFLEISCSSFQKKSPWELLKASAKIFKGTFTSHKHLRLAKPDLLVGFGSFYTLPPLLAGALRQIPLVLYAADVIPGRVVRLMSPYAAVTVLHFAEAAVHIRGKTELSSMPLRSTMRQGTIAREEAYARLGLNPAKKTLLIFGGSQGARRINALMEEVLTARSWDIQLLHYTGSQATTEHLQKVYAACNLPAIVKPFEPEMALALTAADIAIARAGASTLAELAEFEVPALLIPYPYATDDHQEKNASCYIQRTQGALKFTEALLDAKTLTTSLDTLLRTKQLAEMKAHLRKAKGNRPLKSLCDHVLETLSREKKR